jgi:DNA end-binding protein Ku
MIETLRYADEIQKADQFYADVPSVKPDKELLGLAEELIKRKAKPFDPKAFKDPYEAALREVIDAKLAHRKPEQVEEPQLGAQVIDLMEALKRSVKGGGAATKSSRKEEAPKKTAKGKSKAKASGGNGKGKRAA